MHSCEKVLQSLWDYLDREMEQAEVSLIRQHLDLCRSCFSVVEFEQRLRDHMREKTNHMCPEKLKKKIQEIIQQF